MKSKRLIIETTDGQKENLTKILQNQGKTLTDWFNDKVEEEAAIYITKNKIFESDQINSLKELGDIKSCFKRLSEEDWDFSNDDTNYLSHNIHPYPAKYIPQIPNKVIQLLSLPGEKVWDPFGGSGTSALEALLLGRQAISSDINPISTFIGEAKTKALNKHEEEEVKNFANTIFLLSKNNENIEHALEQHSIDIKKYIPIIPNIEKWFHKYAVEELSYLRWAIDMKLKEPCKTLALSVFSKIITRVSFQDGETRYASKPRKVDRGSTLFIFYNELESTLRKVIQLPGFLQHRQAKFIIANSVTDRIVDDNSVDLVVTSPPYPNTTDYHLYHRFRIFWMGFDPKTMGSKEIGSHLRHQKTNTDIEEYLSEMKYCLENIYRGLRYGRYAVFVIGDGVYKSKQFDTATLLETIAQKIGFTSAGQFSRKLPEHKRSFGSEARRLRQEKILILVKPDLKQEFILQRPAYKLWPYEEELRKYEINSLLLGNAKLTDSKSDSLVISSLAVDHFKRLTFTHEFSGRKFSKEKSWQAILENGDNLESKSNRKEPKYVTHGLHPYKGKFYPQLAKTLFNVGNIEHGQKVLDPFCGSGTVLLESCLNGFNSTGFDINPLALKIARAKVSILAVDPILIDQLLLKFITDIRKIKVYEKAEVLFQDEILMELKSWFPDKVLRKLTSIYILINEIPDICVMEFLEVCLSSIIREISHQDPKDLRIRRRKDLINDAPVIELLERKIKKQMERLRSFFQKCGYSPVSFGITSVNQGDCRLEEPFLEANLLSNPADAVVTSPPYATALPYIDTDRLSILLLFGKKSKDRAILEKKLIGAREISNTERQKFEESIERKSYSHIQSELAVETINRIYGLNKKSDVGFRRKNMAALLYRYYDDMSMVFSNLDKYIKNNGSLFFVIGDNKTLAGGENINIRSGRILIEMGKNLGWSLENVIPITVTQENRIHNKNSITENEIIWFRK